MKKVLSYTGLAIGSPLVVGAFVTSNSYFQLAIATLLYMLLVYSIYKIFPRQQKNYVVVPVASPPEPKPVLPTPEPQPVSDIDKRGFLKLIGAAGLSFFLFSIIGRKSNIPLLGKITGINTDSLTGPDTSSNNNIVPEGYNVSEIEDDIVSFYGFSNKEGGWYILKEDTDNGSFRYAKGETDFPKNWENRKNLKYDYYHNIF